VDLPPARDIRNVEQVDVEVEVDLPPARDIRDEGGVTSLPVVAPTVCRFASPPLVPSQLLSDRAGRHPPGDPPNHVGGNISHGLPS
jgi:hypothetical protein